MLLPWRAVPPAPVSPCQTSVRRKRCVLNNLEVIFSATDDQIRVQSHADRCSATWDAALSHGRLESDRGDGTGVAIRPEEPVWLDSIRTFASDGWLRPRRMTGRGWLGRPLASSGTMTGATG
jgi:hypothetical protein